VKRVHLLAAISVATILPVAVLGCDDPSGSGPLSLTDFDAGFTLPDGRAPSDKDAVDTTLTSTPPALTNQTEARFEFTSTRPGRFGCRIDGQSPAECASPFSVTVKEGKHAFEVSAVADDGAIDPTPATFEWTVDATPPKTTITKAPAALDNSTSVSFEFSATEPATFECAVDTAAPVACTSPFPVTKLGDGEHTFSVSAKDAAGNVEAPPATHTWTIDTSLPDTTIDSGPTGAVSATSATFTFSSPSSDSTITFECSVDAEPFAACTSPQTVTSAADGARTFRARARNGAGSVDPTPAERTWTVDTVAPTVEITGGPNGPTQATAPSFPFVAGGDATTVECRVDSGAFAACTSPFMTPSLADGGHAVAVRVKDAAGNTATATRGFTVDTGVPSVTITSGPSGPTSVTAPTFAFTTEAGASTTCSIDGAAFAACTSPLTTATLAEGNHTFDVHATDGAGNVGTANRSFSVDTSMPIVAITGGPSGPTSSKSGTFTFDVNEPSTTNMCRIGAGAFAACTASYAFGPLTDGPYTFEVQATDAAGNTGSKTQTFTVDTIAPTVTITSGPMQAIIGGSSITFTFTAEAGATKECRIYRSGNPSGAYAPCSSPYTTTAPLPPFPPTTYADWVFEVRATDAASNSKSATFAFTTYIIT
jgi:hypothetical protein